ncbi:MAG: sulfate adenylyltransferase subunit CysN [Candidatus Acidiferrum sp.]|jgi:sulfate adenylyltransferase large subunit
MASAPVIHDSFEQFLQADLKKELLRFTTAGSVDDGKSTLIGRLLYDAKGVYEDQLASVRKSRVNRSSGPIDFSLLTDGLRVEREQGITIDVAYRYFATARRKFIIADTPGHEQYTRNMATGASTASLAVILLDASKGLLPQTRRHTYIASLLGIPNILVAVNKMDLVGYSKATFFRLREEFLSLVEPLNFSLVQCVPVSALEGDNIVDRSGRTNWYSGSTLLEHLETVPVRVASALPDFRFPIQSVIRPDSAFRGFAGQIAAGTIHPGDLVVALPSKQTTRVQSIVTFDGQLHEAGAPQSITLKLDDEIDLSRGDMLVSPSQPPAISNRFSASLVWLHEQPLRKDVGYLLKHTTRQVKARVTDIRHRIDINTLAQEPARDLTMNGIALVHIETTTPLFFDPYSLNRATGSFILLDPLSNATVGAGMMREDLTARQVSNDQPMLAAEKAARYGHRPGVFLLPNRASLTNTAARALFENGFATIIINGDQISSGYLPSLLASVCSAGLSVLLVIDQPSRRLVVALKRVAGDSLFNLGPDSDRKNLEEITAQILSHAEKLRIDSPFNQSEKESKNV